tara:strand:- start:1690 stop:2232 length:543 start_codon:yes stop_codon:yes gene_type:complete
MRVLLDTCVLIPNPIRNILLGLAERDLFFPLWSEKIFDEWKFFVSNNTNTRIEQTKIEILLMKSKWKNSLVSRDISLENSIVLPDVNDVHVLASAVTGKAQVLLTNNLKDFPSRTLARFNLIPRNVDSLLFEFFCEFPEIFEPIVQTVFETIQQQDCNFYSKRSFLKRHGLHRLAKIMIS